MASWTAIHGLESGILGIATTVTGAPTMTGAFVLKRFSLSSMRRGVWVEASMFQQQPGCQLMRGAAHACCMPGCLIASILAECQLDSLLGSLSPRWRWGRGLAGAGWSLPSMRACSPICEAASVAHDSAMAQSARASTALTGH